MTSRFDELNSIAGFLIPVFSEDPIPGRRPRHGLAPADYHKVMAGYACPECLADFGGVYRLVCPVCRFQRDVDADIAYDPPALWTDALRERQEEEQPAGTVSVDEFIHSVMNDPDIDQMKL
jgi:hypothetical protein